VITESRPNILLILTDQQSFKATGYGGNPHMKTPGIDRLAEEGVRYENAYCTNPLCTPARASIMTGQMAHQVGIDGLNQPIRSAQQFRELGHCLSEAGYECLYGGKWHIPDNDIDDTHGFRRVGVHDDLTLTDSCIRALTHRDATRPFFLVASYDDPHNICDWARFQNLPWGDIPEPPLNACPNLPVNHARAPYEPSALIAEFASHPTMFCGYDYSPDDWRRYLYGYCRMVERVDCRIEALLNAVRALGLDEETVVIFTSDHGDGMAAHRWNQKMALYEESVRVPLIVRDHRHLRPGAVRVPVSAGYDVYATICDYAGIAMPEGSIGSSLRLFRQSAVASGARESVYAETYFNPSIRASFRGTKGRMVRSERYKYVLYSWGKNREQLYDLDDDPGEMVNLAHQARREHELKRHRAMMRDWIERTDDSAALACMRGSIVPND
jgi:arylsulfatase A-like enzyme